MPNLLQSMTGFARSQGEIANHSWAFEVRSVNSRGLDFKVRLPPGLDALEPALREMAQKSVRRGAVSVSLALKRRAEGAVAADPLALSQALALALDLAARIPGAPAPRAEALLALPGVMRQAAEPESEEGQAALLAALRKGFGQALEGLVSARAAEGGRIGGVIAALLDEIAALHGEAAAQAGEQAALHRRRIAAQLADLLQAAPPLPEERIAQEIALLATKSDVREELDRLGAHIEAARALLGEGEAIGRKFDFLVQEFVREANTLCSKSVSLPLTGTGLRLKAVIEQLREQVQNVE